ncbi:YadA-like family protein, partial [Acinetobacter sp. ANC 5033]|uniref:YadA-like family protein n=1 Tax=Acinetobacter amyesii TaxID=2942470 RepID=UPI00201B5673
PKGTVDFDNTDGNIVIGQSGTDLTFDLAKNIAVDSITAGNSKLDINGLTVTDTNGSTVIGSTGLSFVNAAGTTTGPSITPNGIDAGNQKITSVGAGSIGAGSTDAVNGSQIHDLVGSTAYVDGNGVTQTTVQNIGGTGEDNINDAIQSVNDTANKGINFGDGTTDNNFALGDTINVTGDSNITTETTADGVQVKLNSDIAVDSITAGNSKLDTTGLVINDKAAGTNTILGAGILNVSGGSNTLVLDAVKGDLTGLGNKDLSAADFAQAGRAATEEQLKLVNTAASDAQATADKGFALQAQDGSKVQKALGEAVEVVGADSNITTKVADGQIQIELAKDLAVDSIVAGNSTLNTNGLTVAGINGSTVIGSTGLSFINGAGITTGPSISVSGINAGNTVITNVAAGAVNKDSQDAVNGSQLHAAQDNVSNVIGGNATVNNQGDITVSNIGGTGKDTIHDAISSIKDSADQANKGWNLSTNGGAATNVKPTDTVNFGNTDGNVNISNDGSNVTVNLNKDQNLGKDGSLTVGDTKIDNNGLTIEGGPSVTNNGIDAGNKQITNVADGQIAAGSQDAVNGGQVHDMMGSGAYDANGNLNNIGGTGENNINDAIAAVNKNAAAAKSTVEAGNNIKVETTQNADGSTNYVVSTQDDIKLNSVTANEINAGTVNADQVVAGNTTIDTNGVSIKDGPSMTISGIDAGNKAVSNVSNGVQNSDAVNMGQLAQYLGGGAGYNNITQSFDAPNYEVNGGSYNNVGDALGALNQADQALGNRITNLGDQLQQAFQTTNKRIDDVEKKANAGIAAAMALENAPYIPGKYTYAAGAAYHGGENAVGVTLRKTADNGRWSLTGGVAAGSSGDPSVRVGISGVID